MEIAPGVHSLRQDKGGHVHAFLLDDGNELTLIDTLFDTDGKIVLDAISAIGRKATDLKHIVLTHGHRSHLGGLRALENASGAAVYAHEWEADIVAGHRKAQSVSLIPSLPLHVWWPTIPFQFGLNLGLGSHLPCDVDHNVSDGDRVGPLHVVHTPGHSPGHLSFWWPERATLFAGDAIATWPALAAGWPAFNLNVTKHRASLRRMAGFGAATVAVGHGEPVTVGAADQVRKLAASIA